MIRTILIDDETDSVRILQKLLQKYCPDVSVIGTAEGVESGEVLIREHRPDLVFLDIEMTRGNAFDLLNRLQPVNFQVIFVTAFDNHAIRAIRYSAVDYLLKPVNIGELCAAVEKLSGKLAEKNVLHRVTTLLDHLGGGKPDDQKMAIPTINGYLFVNFRDILRLEAKGAYTIFHLTNGEQIMATGIIKEYEDLLPETMFYRIHNSHIINLNKIKKYQRGRGGYVTMEDDSLLEVATRRREDFVQKLVKRC
ncbi:MAG TPA: LytTR family DNA-binding domain-containing protein [Puia sp.]|jgi:two-component system LytT family response regulator|nr:LytTR family DNA-binding domain-containing protein [Puia sp.]